MGNYEIKRGVAWGTLITSLLLFWATYPSRVSYRPPFPELTEWIGIPVLLLILAGLLFLCYLCRSWLGVGIVAVGLAAGILGGTFKEFQANRYHERFTHAHHNLFLNQRDKRQNWTRHKLMAGVCLAGGGLSAAMLRDRV
ncbi:hypothetical protein Pla110_15020 [Polystyrenella longa]|uniref:Uncharacterized protein n=1 Tax=Polystyrenella longa TaxID=2528007 RepID=A0A518CKP2_9PLAN|nr:hypothetical protein [Polystyrenella longa]QDU79788.1 hypothetical protein Pla110_15020 [Polystyrenella longa]